MIPDRNPKNSMSRKGNHRFQRSVFLWLAMAVLFLLLMLAVLWVGVRTRVDEEGGGLPRGGACPLLLESDPCHVAWPTAARVGYPSPFRPEAPETVEAPATQPAAEPAPSREEVVYRSHPNDRMEIALSFDDGPHPRLTPRILDILEEYDIRATFFMVGENVGYYPAAAHAVAEAGHEIANHTFSHRRFGHMGAEDLRREITSCEEALASITDAPVRLVRPPEGEMNEAVRLVAGELDYRIILWDVDTRDWAHTPPEAISKHILDTIRPGDIILMHDFIGYDSPTPEALRMVIPALLERGYHFVTVGELVDGQ